jgi:predicted permease
MFRNMLIIGIICGVIVNLSGFTFPSALTEAIDLMVRAALPTALFGLGGILFRYRPDGDLPTVGFIVTVSLIVHPLVVWGMGKMLGLPLSSFRSAVVTSAMAPGVNAFLFANMYGQARRVAASAVLLGTAVSIVTASFWLVLLP